MKPAEALRRWIARQFLMPWRRVIVRVVATPGGYIARVSARDAGVAWLNVSLRTVQRTRREAVARALAQVIASERRWVQETAEFRARWGLK